jgi:hypothetical protein
MKNGQLKLDANAIAIGIAPLRKKFLRLKVNYRKNTDYSQIKVQTSPLARLRDLSKGEGAIKKWRNKVWI